MQIDTSTFLNIAEIAATFAGFSALVSALGQRTPGDASALHDLLRLRLVIASSILTVIASLVPIALAGFDLSSDLVWWIACALFVTMTLGLVRSFVSSYRPVAADFEPDLPVFVIVSTLEVGIVAMLGVIVFRADPALDHSLYLSVLVISIAQAALVFARLIGSTLHHERLSDRQ